MLSSRHWRRVVEYSGRPNSSSICSIVVSITGDGLCQSEAFVDYPMFMVYASMTMMMHDVLSNKAKDLETSRCLRGSRSRKIEKSHTPSFGIILHTRIG